MFISESLCERNNMVQTSHLAENAEANTETAATVLSALQFIFSGFRTTSFSVRLEVTFKGSGESELFH